MDGIKEMLKGKLGTAYTDELAAAIDAEVDKIAGGLMVSRKDFNDIKRQLKDATGKTETDEDLKKQIETLKAEHVAELEKERGKRNGDRLARALKDAGVKNAKALSALLDGEKIKYSDDKIEGLDEQIAALKQSDGYLFANPTDNTPPGTGIPAGTPPAKAPVTANTKVI